MAANGNPKEEPGSLFEEVKRRLTQKEGKVSNNPVVPEGLAEALDSIITAWENIQSKDEVIRK